MFDSRRKLIILSDAVLNVNRGDILGNELEVRKGTYQINEFNKVTGYGINIQKINHISILALNTQSY